MKVAFLDRDGVINKKAEEHGYITRKEDFIFNEGIFEVCHQLQKRGFELVTITNQRGIARGLYTEETLGEIHGYMKEEFKRQGITIMDIFYCPHEEGVCDCRKPKDGMLRKALVCYPISLAESILISDSLEDVEMGRIFGIGTVLFVSSDHPEEALQQLCSREGAL